MFGIASLRPDKSSQLDLSDAVGVADPVLCADQVGEDRMCTDVLYAGWFRCLRAGSSRFGWGGDGSYHDGQMVVVVVELGVSNRCGQDTC